MSPLFWSKYRIYLFISSVFDDFTNVKSYSLFSDVTETGITNKLIERVLLKIHAYNRENLSDEADIISIVSIFKESENIYS
jgi:hypothetical protein